MDGLSGWIRVNQTVQNQSEPPTTLQEEFLTAVCHMELELPAQLKSQQDIWLHQEFPVSHREAEHSK